MSNQGNIKILTADLVAQANTMKTLKEDYNALFGQVVSILNEMNDGWSENLSNNFSTKITTAQKGFAKIVEMLESGETVAKEASTGFTEINAAMAKQIANGPIAELFTAISSNLGNLSLNDMIGTGINLDTLTEKWKNSGFWNDYKDALNYLTEGDLYQGLAELEGKIFGTSHLSQSDSILDLAQNLIDGKLFNSENIDALTNIINLDKLGEQLGFIDGPHLKIIAEGTKKIFGDGENIESLQDYVIDYCYSMDDMKAAFRDGNYLEATTGTILYSLENSTRVIGDVILDGVTGTVNGVLDITGLDESVPWGDIKNSLEGYTGVDFDIVMPAITDGISQGYSDFVDAAVQGAGYIEDAIGEGLEYVGDGLADIGSSIAGFFGF